MTYEDRRQWFLERVGKEDCRYFDTLEERDEYEKSLKK